SNPVSGKDMMAQATNTGDDPENSLFDISVLDPTPCIMQIVGNRKHLVPGGEGTGIFSGRTKQYNSAADCWGAAHDCASSRSKRNTLLEAIRQGHYYRFDVFLLVDNLTINFQGITRPSDITANTGCVRKCAGG
ncbi:Glycoside Hydrolase Family 45 protein, partial [Tuber magnatum]